MMNILKKIKEREERTGLMVVQNPFTLGATVVVKETGETIYSGEDVGCMLFVMKIDELLRKGQNDERSVASKAK